MTDIIQMHVKKPYFDLLEAGSKSVELRLNDGKRKSIKIGDKICFVCQSDDSKSIVLPVSDIIFSSSFSKLLEKIDPNSLGGSSPQKQITELEDIYDQASINKYGVLALILGRAP